MSQVVGSTSLGYIGLRIASGPNGGVIIFVGGNDPNTINDLAPSGGTIRDTLNNCDLMSLYLSPALGKIWVKTANAAQDANSGTWTQLTIP